MINRISKSTALIKRQCVNVSSVCWTLLLWNISTNMRHFHNIVCNTVNKQQRSHVFMFEALESTRW